ncbi:MAG: hypothetical protein IV100_19600 [Myxococcales bacterium]|nr:hypothetical protein [Myxococcales bacterium]
MITLPLSRFGCLLLVTSMAGCEGDSGPSETAVIDPNSLVDHAAWRALAADADPFPDRPAEVSCAASAYGIDAGAFGVYTGDCNYITASQNILLPLVPGDVVEVEAGYGTLLSENPAEGHLAISLPGLPLLDVTAAIPGPPQYFVKEIPVTVSLPAGAPILFHVHNHGPNSWRVLRVERKRPAPTTP